MALNIPIAVRALRPAKFPLPFPKVLFGAPVAQLHSAERHRIDPIDQFANVFLIRAVTKFVLRIGFVAQPRHQCVRMIWNPHAVTSQKPQSGNTVAASRRFRITDTPHLLAALHIAMRARCRHRVTFQEFTLASRSPDTACARTKRNAITHAARAHSRTEHVKKT
jgi:hypothetical protein